MVLTRVLDNLKISDDKKCHFCNGNHLCRDCPQEILLAPILKKFIGTVMENFIGDNFCCPVCQNKTMKVLGNHTPSLDLVCSNCYRKFEVKSKCLSVEKLPLDLKLPHGNYSDYKKRQELGLDLFVIIYKVDRRRKNITIREVLYANNNEIKKNKNIKVVKRRNSHLSNIFINDKGKLVKLDMEKSYKFDFSGIIKSYLNDDNKIENSIVSCDSNLEV